jgi:hypothetical protein
VNTGAVNADGVLAAAVINQGSQVVSVIWSVALVTPMQHVDPRAVQLNYTMTSTCASCYTGEWRDLNLDMPANLRFPVQPAQNNIEYRMQWGQPSRKRDTIAL